MLPFLWFALAALLLWLPQNVQHEGMHALAAKRYGASITKLWPFPSRGEDGHFRFAYVLWEGGEYTDREYGWISAAPQIANVAVTVLLLPLLHLVALPAALFTILGAWAVVNWFDGSVALATFYRRAPDEESPSWWPGYAEHTDGWKWQRCLSVSPWVCRGLAVLWHGGVGFVLWRVVITTLLAA